jgi:hypothetical protein
LKEGADPGHLSHILPQALNDRIGRKFPFRAGLEPYDQKAAVASGYAADAGARRVAI